MTEQLHFSNNIDRLPPQNVEVEEVVLGGILFDPGAYERVADRLKPEMFYLLAHRDIYRAVVTLSSKDKPTDLISVANWLENNDLLPRVGGRSKLLALVNRTISAINIESLADIIADKHRRRQLIKVGSEIISLGFETQTDLQEVLELSESKLLDVCGGIFGDREPIPLADIMLDAFGRIEERHNGKKVGFPTGFYDLDGMLNGGLKPGKLIIVAARPGCGKSSFLGNVAINMAENGIPSVIFSLEMGTEEWGDRFISQDAKIESSVLQSGKLNGRDWESLSDLSSM